MVLPVVDSAVSPSLFSDFGIDQSDLKPVFEQKIGFLIDEILIKAGKISIPFLGRLVLKASTEAEKRQILNIVKRLLNKEVAGLTEKQLSNATLKLSAETTGKFFTAVLDEALERGQISLTHDYRLMASLMWDMKILGSSITLGQAALSTGFTSAALADYCARALNKRDVEANLNARSLPNKVSDFFVGDPVGGPEDVSQKTYHKLVQEFEILRVEQQASRLSKFRNSPITKGFSIAKKSLGKVTLPAISPAPTIAPLGEKTDQENSPLQVAGLANIVVDPNGRFRTRIYYYRPEAQKPLSEDLLIGHRLVHSFGELDHDISHAAFMIGVSPRNHGFVSSIPLANQRNLNGFVAETLVAGAWEALKEVTPRDQFQNNFRHLPQDFQTLIKEKSNILNAVFKQAKTGYKTGVNVQYGQLNPEMTAALNSRFIVITPNNANYGNFYPADSSITLVKNRFLIYFKSHPEAVMRILNNILTYKTHIEQQRIDFDKGLDVTVNHLQLTLPPEIMRGILQACLESVEALKMRAPHSDILNSYEIYFKSVLEDGTDGSPRSGIVSLPVIRSQQAT